MYHYLTNRCNITESGKAALLRLSKGDMRRALNVLQVSPRLVMLPKINLEADGFLNMTWRMDGELQADLQACHAAYDVIDESAVYTCTGNPQPKDIERVVQSMMSDEFGTSYSRTYLRFSSFFLICFPLPRLYMFEEGQRKR